MAQWSITELSSVTSFDRIDGEYYLPEYLENQLKLSQTNTVALPQWFFVSDGNHLSVSKHFCETGEVPYFRGQDVNDFFLENADPIRIPRKVYESPMMKRSHFFNEDVLLSIVGTIGSLSFVSDEIREATGSCKIAILRSKGQSSPYFLAAFLMSKYGQLQIKRNTRGAVQMGLILKDFSRLRIPIISQIEQSEIETIIKHAIKQNHQSKALYEKAQKLLDSELGIDNLKLKKPMGYTARFSNIEQARRIDPEHFYPALQHIIDRLPGSIDLVPLGPQLQFCQRGRQPAYAQKGLPVINSKHVHSNKIVFEDNRTANFSHDSELQIRYGDVLINGTGRGTLGRAAPFLIKEPAIPDNHVTILRSSNLDPAYLSFYLNSQAGQLQVEMHQRGSSGQLELYPFDIRKFLVWVAPESLQKEIRKLYDQAIENERRSKKLIAQAKHRVEELIEQAVEGSGEKP
ncbi:MAG: restriction endonuclease subunit S [Desulfotignum sp.]|nr:restriction endonuclease subunit S [Desulfotignum sp.]MCF8089973.1 restriction endonuclease subunit S [Desulfotignum sp.]MCF8138943.1 restriction endonuclease subunit S [Desulfotignum sp.]